MDTGKMIRETRAVMKKHKNDFVPTFQTNISAMCRDIIPKLEQLKEYEDLEKQRKLLKLPCAVGDIVYRVYNSTKLSIRRVYKCKVIGIKQNYNSFYIKLHANINEETYSIWIDNWFDKCQIGHEFFLTKQEAEQALQKIKKEQIND